MDPNNPQHVKVYNRRVFMLSKSIPFHEVEDDILHLDGLIKKHYPKGNFKIYEVEYVPRSEELPLGAGNISLSKPLQEFDLYLEDKYKVGLRRDAVRKMIYRELWGLTNDPFEAFME